MRTTARRLLPVLLALLPAGAARAQAADVAVYRRSPTELWVYDTRPEVGVATHVFDDAAVRRLQELDVRLVRHTMYWNQVENTTVPGRYDPRQLAHWDALVRRARDAGIELLVVVHGNAPGVTWENRQEGYRRYARFMGAMAARYPSVRYWELWNEMDQGFTDLFGATRPGVSMRDRGRMYAEMLKLAYPAVKRANPRAWVLNGGMTDWRDFPRGIYEAGGRDYFDFMSLHTYGAPVLHSFRVRGEELRALMARHGDAGKPLWNTEFGIDAGSMVNAWGVPSRADPRRDDGARFDELHLENWRDPLEHNARARLYAKTIGYALYAKNEAAGDRLRREARLPRGRTSDDYGFGLLRDDARTPRPAFEWLRQRRYNAPLRAAPVRTVDVEVPLPAGTEPVGYAWAPAGSGRALLRGVRVGTAEPTVVRLRRR